MYLMFQQIYKKRVLFISIFLIILLGTSNAQIIKIGARSGYGFYEQSGVKSLQLKLIDEINIENVEAVESFPSSINYSFYNNFYLNENKLIGFDISFFSTGGRNHLKDYSGEYKLDMILNGTRIGISFLHREIVQNNFCIYGRFNTGILFSKLKLNENLTIYDEQLLSDKYKFYSTSLAFEPSVVFAYEIVKNISIDLKLAYDINLGSELHLKDNKDAKIGHKTNWSGFRVSLGLNYNMNLSK